MTDWLGTFQTISARLGDRLYGAEPAWVWSRDGSSIAWCNPAGAAMLGFADLAAMAALNLPENHNLRRDIANVARTLGAGGTLARLRFYSGGRTSPVLCRCERLRLDDGRTLLSITGIEPVDGRSASNDSDLAAFAGADASGAFVLDQGGRALAGPGTLENFSGDTADAVPGRVLSAQANVDGKTRAVRYVRLEGANGPRLLLWAGPPTANGAADSMTDVSDAAPPDGSVPEAAESHSHEAGFSGSAELEAEAAGPVESGDQQESLSRQADILRTALRDASGQERGREQDREQGQDRGHEAGPGSNSWTEAFEHLPKKPVRFLWQTDADDRFLFVSPGLEQLVGRTSQIVGERWCEISDRMRLDPVGRISHALAERDTWSGFTAWWPTDDHAARIPAELTALPVFSVDQLFQGYRGFGVLKPAEALSAESFDRRFPGDPVIVPESVPLARTAASSVSLEAEPDLAANVVPIRSDIDRLPEFARLSPQERSAFDEIASALRTHPGVAQIFSDAAPAAFRYEANDSDASVGNHGHVAADDESGGAVSDGIDDGRPEDEPGFEYSTDASDPAFLASLPDDDGDYPPDIDENGDENGDENDDECHLNEVEVEQSASEPPTDDDEAGPDLQVDDAGQPVAEETERQSAAGFGSAREDTGDDAPVDEGLESVDGGLEIIDEGSEGETNPGAGDGPAGEDQLGLQPGNLVAPQPANDDRAAFSGLAQAADLADAQKQIGDLTAILDAATDGIVILDQAGLVLSLNTGAGRLFGQNEDAVVGTPFVELLGADSQQLALDCLDGLRPGNPAYGPDEGREISALSGGDEIPLFMTMGRIGGDDDGRICVTLRDIRRWKQTEAELIAGRDSAEQASSQKSDFLARVSHEIRTPLNAIIGFAEVMIEERFGSVENDRYREYLRDIRTSGEHVVSLVNDLLDISKIEAGKLDLTFAAVAINDLVRECVALMQPQANRAKVIVRSSYAADLPSIVADPRTMRQVVLNLLSNSVKFTGSGGQVVVSTTLSETGEATLRVRDTGPGMSEDDLARVLEPFRQLSTSRIGDENGTGLGLPLTKALVEANRASFTISSARGEGTIVQVTFPATRVLSE